VREPAASERVFGLMAEFNRPERLVEAVRRTREAGFERVDAHTPFPVEGLAEELGFHDQRVPWLTLLGGIVGAGLGYGMQVYTNQAFPLDIGNRPLVAPPAFMLITFELLVLGAVLFSITSMLGFNHLPRLNHPLFGVDSFRLASTDKFFLVVLSNDPKFDPRHTRAFLHSLDPVRVGLVGQTEEPE
jgi:Protein of unknown function (DUF3341)